MQQSRQARGYPPIQIPQQSQQPTASALVPAPQQQGVLVQIPPAFVRLRQQRQPLSSKECPRCQKPVVVQNAPFCVACGLPLVGAPCPSCQNLVDYYPNHVSTQGSRAAFFCPHCGTELEWRQQRGGPAYLIVV